MLTKKVRAVCAASVLCCWGLAVSDARGQSPPPGSYVDADATGANDGSSWQDAFTDLQSAINAQSFRVWVAAGTYTPSVIPPNVGNDPRHVAFSPREDSEFLGGFAGTEDPATFNLSERAQKGVRKNIACPQKSS